MMTRNETNESDNRGAREMSGYLEQIETMKRWITEIDQHWREILSLNDTLKSARMLHDSTPNNEQEIRRA